MPKEYRLRSKTILKKIDAELNVPRDLKPYMSDVDFVIVNEKIFNSIPRQHRFKDWSIKIGEKYSVPVSPILSKIHQKLINTKIGGIRNRWINYILLKDEDGYRRYKESREKILKEVERKIGREFIINDILILDELIK